MAFSSKLVVALSMLLLCGASCTSGTCRAAESPLAQRGTVAPSMVQRGSLSSKLQNHFTLEGVLDVRVGSATEFPATMQSFGVEMETLGACMLNTESTVKDGNGKSYSWLDFERLHPMPEGAIYPLHFRIDTTHLPGSIQLRQYQDARSELHKNMLQEMLEKVADVGELKKRANETEHQKRFDELRAEKTRIATLEMLHIDEHAAVKASIESAHDWIEKKCEKDGLTQDCMELGVCKSVSAEVFKEEKNFQDPSPSQIAKLVDTCKKEEAKVRAKANDYEGLEKQRFLKVADALLPKCQHIGLTMKGYLATLDKDTVTSVDHFCGYMVNWVIPLDEESRCDQFIELVAANHWERTKKKMLWPHLVDAEGFGQDFNAACDTYSDITDCKDKKGAVETASRKYISDQKEQNKTSSAVDVGALRLEQKYEEEMCKALGLELVLVTEEGLALMEQRQTSRGLNVLRRKKSRIILEIIGFAMLTDAGMNRMAYYKAAAVDMVVGGGDVGIGYGYKDTCWVWFSQHNCVLSGMFASGCKQILTTATEADMSVTFTRFGNYGDIPGVTFVISVGGSYYVGAEGSIVWCCPACSGIHGCAFPGSSGSSCYHCGITVAPQVGFSASASMGACHTTNPIIESPALIPVGWPIAMKSPFAACFPGHATVQTPVGHKRMQDLRVGDRVLTVGPDGALLFDDVYFFGHADPYSRAPYLGLRLVDEVLHLSSDHFVPICRSQPKAACSWQNRLEVHARNVKVGDAIWIKGQSSLGLKVVSAIETHVFSGLFNPYTRIGTIVVDGVVASCHSSWILDDIIPQSLQSSLPRLYQAIFLPGRWLYHLFGPSAASALDMNNPQHSPESFGYGPMFVFSLYVLFPTSGFTLCARMKSRRARCSELLVSRGH